jgi:DNA-binding winged helix-turn-helix (wHTH) protein
MTKQRHHFYDFGPFHLDATNKLLLCDRSSVPLELKQIDTLIVLVEQHGEVISKDELIKRVWPDTFVEEGSLAHHVYVLRKILSARLNGEDCIETYPKRGYRFSAPVAERWEEISPSGPTIPPAVLNQGPRGIQAEIPTPADVIVSNTETQTPQPASLDVAPETALGSGSHSRISTTRSYRLLVPGLLALAIAALVAFSITSRHPWKPQVLFVWFSGQEGNLYLSIGGLGFGQIPAHLPLTGDIPWFRIGDVSCFGVKPGTCEAGFKGDTYPLTYTSWSDNRVEVASSKVGSPGDAVEVAIWNPQSNNPQDAAIWGGNVPPVRPGTPQISNVTFSGAGKDLHITIEGISFGQAPPGVPGIGDTEFLQIGDYAFHSPNVEFSIFFRAGYRNDTLQDQIALVYGFWSDTKIEILGFGGPYGQNGLVVRSGDPIAIDLWNTKTHLATAWGGRVP